MGMDMKCVCGYIYISRWNSKSEKETIKGDKPFKKIHGTFLIEYGHSFSKEEVELYACPKCGTVRSGHVYQDLEED